MPDLPTLLAAIRDKPDDAHRWLALGGGSGTMCSLANLRPLVGLQLTRYYSY